MQTDLETSADPQESAVFVHAAAICESRQVGEGTRIWPFTHVMEGAVVGRDCNIGEHVFIEGGVRVGDRVTIKNQVMIWEGVTVEDDVFLGPGMIFTNDPYPRSRRTPAQNDRYGSRDRWLRRTLVRQGASIGAGAIILCGNTIGRYGSVGAGAVVTSDVPSHRLAVGNPARCVGWACICGMSLDDALRCWSCSRQYRMIGQTLLAVE
ncbi:MAG: acyltransferase [Phycisphaerae bacterium]